MTQLDLDSVLEIMNAALSEAVEGSDGQFVAEFSDLENREYLQMVHDSHESVGLVADDDRTVVGYVIAIPAQQIAEPLTEKTLWVDDLAVRRDRRRQGVAKLLMEAMEEYARNRGYQQIRLNVHEFNTAARDFYAATEYECWSRIMAKRL
jgi:GNAT superfamily N-acetyltransferase